MGTRASDEEDVWGEMKEVTKMETSGCEVCVWGSRSLGLTSSSAGEKENEEKDVTKNACAQRRKPTEPNRRLEDAPSRRAENASFSTDTEHLPHAGPESKARRVSKD